MSNYSPHDLLPIKNPFEESPDEDYFYENVVKYLVPDIVRMMYNGITLDWDKVQELTKTVQDVIKENHIALHENEHIKAYLEIVKGNEISEIIKVQESKFKTPEECLVPFKEKDTTHRAYLINTYLQDNGLIEYVSDKWLLTDLKKLNTILNLTFIENIINKKWLLLRKEIDRAMFVMAKDKAEIYNRERMKTVDNHKEKLKELTFNMGSSKQKNELFDMLEIETLNRTPTGAKKIDREELQRLQEELKILREDETLNTVEIDKVKQIIDIMIDDSNAAIINNNFIPAFNKFSIESVLYGNFKLFGAKSFRLTSNSPNLLNLPSSGNKFAKTVKQCFIAPEGYLVYAVDLSALEDRVIANLSLDENKCNIFLKNLDSHCLNSMYYVKEKIEAILPRDEDESDVDYCIRYKNEVDNGNKELKQIRQDHKCVTFGLSYGCGAKKVASTLSIPEYAGKQIYDRYHNELYKDITKFREQVVLPKAKEDGKIHLGLGCYLHSDDVDQEARTLFNACSQFWSILTLLAINKIHHMIDEKGYQEDIKVTCSIYDSIYFIVKKDASIIKWLNDNIIPLLTVQFIENQVVDNEAEGELGVNWYELNKVVNNASTEEIQEIINKIEG